jgi:hypothetical protein
MFIRYDALQAQGIEVRPHDDGLEIIPQKHWSKQAQVNFRDFCLGIGLDEKDSEDLASYAETVSVMGAIKKSIG